MSTTVDTDQIDWAARCWRTELRFDLFLSLSLVSVHSLDKDKRRRQTACSARQSETNNGVRCEAGFVHNSHQNQCKRNTLLLILSTSISRSASNKNGFFFILALYSILLAAAKTAAKMLHIRLPQFIHVLSASCDGWDKAWGTCKRTCLTANYEQCCRHGPHVLQINVVISTAAYCVCVLSTASAGHVYGAAHTTLYALYVFSIVFSSRSGCR